MADVALVSLGGTAGLRAADSELAESMRRAGASVSVVSVPVPREVRTFALTDLGWALAARRAAAGEEVAAAACVVYSSVTASFFWPRVGAIRFDSLAVANRPGRHGVWQRPVERRRVREASLLVPWSSEALAGATSSRADSVVVPVPVEPSGPLDGPRDIAAITYGAHPQKKGLGLVLLAWLRVANPTEELVVAGIERAAGEGILRATVAGLASLGEVDAPPGTVPTTREVLRARKEMAHAYTASRAAPLSDAAARVRFTGALPREEYRSLLRRSRIFVTAPRREDHGIAQLEALADGCVLVTTEAPGPYVALPIARELDPRLVVREADALAKAIRAALDDPLPGYAERAEAALAPLTRAAVDATVANELLPRLLPGGLRS